jgi:glycosyltransferase involved in cell wall biosynthesis
MRLLLVASSLGGGGAERVLLRLAEHWRDAGHEVHLVTISSAMADFHSIPSGITRHALGLEADARSLLAGVRANWGRVRALRALIGHVAPRVVVSFLSETNVLALIAGRGSGVPVVVSERVDPRRHSLRRPWEWLRRLTYPQAAGLVVQTEGVAAWARALVAPARVHVVPNAAETLPVGTAPAWLPASPFIAGMGRLTPQKGFDMLIRAFATFSERRPDWRLVILGEGEERAALELLAGGLGLQGRVLLPGAIASPGSVLTSASFFVLSSRYEGFPNALLEAMALGLPCVATDCDSGPREVVSDGVDGLLVRVNDSEALATAMASLADDDGLRQRIGGAARAAAQRYAPAGVFALWDAVLVDALAAGR